MDQRDSVITNINQISRVPDDNELTNRGKTDKSKDNIINNQGNNSPDQSQSSPNLNKASKRPKNTALKQQRLPAWQPILTAKTVLPLFFSIGVIFVVLGGVLFHFSNIVNEYIIDYTDCVSTSAAFSGPCSKATFNQTCTCTVNFTLDKNFDAPVYIYYGLKNFYQNHRRYVKSRDDNQLLGNEVKTVNSECAPYDKIGDKIYAPCGAIANSLFNDSFTLFYNGEAGISTALKIDLLATGIAWNTDKSVKFKNPPTSYWNLTARPVNWQVDVWNLSTDADNNGFKNEDLIVWMRTAALPTFRKFYRRVNHSQISSLNKVLPAGVYSVNINYNYPVVSFNGRKTFIISTTSWIGGKNPFLGIAYLVVGSLCIVLGLVFLVIHFKFAKNFKSTEELSNSNTRSNVATVETMDKN